MGKPAMTPAEAHRALLKLQEEIGGEAYVSLDINHHGIGAVIYPDGLVGHTQAVRYRGGKDVLDLAEIITGLRALWEECGDRLHRELIRKMALEIITITADQGRCSDVALRMKFKANDIKRYGRQAVEEANEIADRGPFSIEAVGGDNGAPEDAEAAI